MQIQARTDWLKETSGREDRVLHPLNNEENSVAGGVKSRLRHGPSPYHTRVGRNGCLIPQKVTAAKGQKMPKGPKVDQGGKGCLNFEKFTKKYKKLPKSGQNQPKVTF